MTAFTYTVPEATQPHRDRLNQPLMPLYNSVKDRAPARLVSFGELAGMAPSVGPKDKAQALTPFEASGKQKQNATAALYHALVIDHDDDDQSAEQIRALYAGHAFYAFTSASHMQDKGGIVAQRWKVVMPLADPVGAARHRELSEGATLLMGTDPAQARGTQVFYAPNKADDAAPFETINTLADHDPLDANSNAGPLVGKALEALEARREAERQAQAAKVKPKPANVPAQGGIVDKALAAYSVRELLDSFGYRKRGSAYLAPESSTGTPGVAILERDGKEVVYSHHGPADPLSADNHGGHALDAFDVLAVLEYAGDFSRAVQVEAARLDPDGQKQRQREYMQDSAASLTLPDTMDTDESAQQAPTQDAEEEPGPMFGYTLVGNMVDHLKPIDWQVKGFLEADSLGLIYGPPKTGKSFLAIDWACSIATGTEWNGRKVKQGAVFYLAGEGHNGLARRFASWQLAKGVTLKDAPLAVSNKAAPLTDLSAAAAVLDSIQHLADTTGQAPAVIVVDTLARNFGGDENATEEMSRFIRHLDEIRANWQCTVLVVHHTGKDKTRGARGNTALTGAIDAGYMVDRDELGNVSLEPTEMKDAELPDPMTFNLEGVRLPMVDEDGHDVYGAHLAPMDSDYQPPQRGRAGRGKNQTQALAKLATLMRDHQDRLAADDRDPSEARVTVEDWRRACIDDGIKKQRWADLRRTLEEAGLVEVTGYHVQATQA